MPPAPRSLILDLLSTLRRGAFPVGALVAAGECFGLEPGSIRVALARLLERGLVSRSGRGRYRLGPAAAAVQEQANAWRRVRSRTRPWPGGWIGVHGPHGDRRARQRAQRALRFLGLRDLVPGLAIRPDNLAGGVEGARERLQALGLAPSALVARIDGLDPETEGRARGLWDVAALTRGYRTQRRALERSEARLASLPQDEAMVESFTVGGRALQQLALDPLLPEPIVATAERDALAEAVRRYDRIGRSCWAPFMREHGVLEPATPADTHGTGLAMTGGAG